MSRQDSMFTFRQVLVVACWGWAGRARLGSRRAGARVRPAWALRGSGSGRAVAGVRGCAEQAGERVDCFEEQRVDAGLLAGGAAGAGFCDPPAVLGLGGELAGPGGPRGGHAGGSATSAE